LIQAEVVAYEAGKAAVCLICRDVILTANCGSESGNKADAGPYFQNPCAWLQYL